MRYVTAWLAALVCASLGSTSLLASYASGGTVEVSLTIDWGIVQTPINNTIVGVSVSADHQGNGLAANGIDAAAIASTTRLRTHMMRFPDDISQSYRWQQAAQNSHLTTFEFWSLATQASQDNEAPDLMITVNMVTGAPDEAARWVSMSNLQTGVNASLRGSAEPFHIKWWLLGEDIRSHNAKYGTPVAYATAALENATRMKAVDPTIKVGLWIDDGSTQEGVEWNAALLTSIKLRDPGQIGNGSKAIDFVALSAVVEVPNRPLTDATLYPSLYGFAATHADKVVLAAEQAVSLQLNTSLPIAVYRFGIEFGAEGWNQDKGDSLGSAITLTGMLNAFARHQPVFTAIYHGLNRDSFGALLQVPSAFEVPAGQRFALNPFGEVLSSYGQFLVGNSLSTDMVGVGANAVKAYYKAPPIGKLAGTERVALISTLAALDADSGQMVLFVASRATNDRVVAHVTIKVTDPYHVNSTALAQAIQSNALSTDSYTGVSRIDPQSEFRNLAFAPGSGNSYQFDLILERNAIVLYVFTVST